MSEELDQSDKHIAWVADELNTYKVNREGVSTITEHVTSSGQWLYHIHYEHDKVVRIFNPKQVCFTSEIPAPEPSGDDIPF